MLYIVGSIFVTSYFIYKYRSNVTYNLLKAFSYIEDYIPKQNEPLSIDNDGIYSVNMDNYTLRIHKGVREIPKNLEEFENDLIFISNGTIFNKIVNSKNTDCKTIKSSDIVAASITFNGSNNTLPQEIDITGLVQHISIKEYGLNLTKESLPIVLVLYNEFYDGNLLIEEFINKEVIFTLITLTGDIISSSSINLNITI